LFEGTDAGQFTSGSLTGLRPGSALDGRGAVVTTDPAPETRVGTIKGSQTCLERGALRNRAFARSTAETDPATAAQIVKGDRVTACAMERLPQTDTLGDSKVEVSDQQLEDTPQMTSPKRRVTSIT
jgi:hypothetical protein